jgi:ferrous iron transport protein A
MPERTFESAGASGEPGVFVKKLKDFAANESGTVVSLAASGAVRRRLFDMGITPGADVVFHKAAPLGDPVEITVRGYRLSIRKAEAETVLMRPDGGTPPR